LNDIGINHALRRGIAFGLLASLVSANASTDIVRLGTPWLKLGVDRSRGQAVALVDARSRQNFFNPAAEGGLWQLEFAGLPALTLSPTNAQACRVDKLGGAEPGARLTWSQFGLSDAPELRVEVTIRLDPQQALSRWQLAVEALPERVLQRIRFPRVLDLPRLERERLAMPFWGGLLAANPRQTFSTKSPGGLRRECDYPGLCSMQCLAFIPTPDRAFMSHVTTRPAIASRLRFSAEVRQIPTAWRGARRPWFGRRE
jgi:hypothetical protein